MLQIVPDEHGYEMDQERAFTVNGFRSENIAVIAKLVCLSTGHLSAVRNKEPCNYFPPTCSILAMPVLQQPVSKPPHLNETIKGFMPLLEI